MAISTRLRYEILRRDGFTCRYCGAKAPDAVLEVDHVLAVALGGTDEPTNLVTACEPCNSGKASTTPDAAMVADVDEQHLQWLAAIKSAQSVMAQRERDSKDQFARFEAAWKTWDKTLLSLDANAPEKLELWLADGLTIEQVCEYVSIAWSAHWIPPANVFAYLCGIVRNKTAELHAIARETLDGGDRGPVD